jgi:HK97 family phage major capsid protein
MDSYTLEKRELQRQIDALLAKPSLNSSERAKCDLLISKMANLRSDDERRFKAEQVLRESGIKLTFDQEEFRQFLGRGIRPEGADKIQIWRPETRTYVALDSSSLIVPTTFYATLMKGISQYTELMDKNNVRLLETDNARSMTIPSIDISTISSAIVQQNAVLAPVANPDLSSNVLKGYSYRTNPIAASFELEQDSFETITDILTTAFSTGLARGIGSDLINGVGAGTAPQGLLTAAANSGVTSAVSGVWSGIDIAAVYGSLNRAYRVSPKCAWVMHDTTYQQILALKDAQGRPLLGIRDDEEKLFGKKVIISPDMPTGAGAKSIVFGDLSQYAVRIARDTVQVRRSYESVGYAEQGIALYTAKMRVDAGLITVGGDVKPVVYATAHA